MIWTNCLFLLISNPRRLLCNERWYATGDNDAINIYDSQQVNGEKIKTIKGCLFFTAVRIYAERLQLWVSDAHKSMQTLVKMIVHKGDTQ